MWYREGLLNLSLFPLICGSTQIHHEKTSQRPRSKALLLEKGFCLSSSSFQKFVQSFLTAPFPGDHRGATLGREERGEGTRRQAPEAQDGHAGEGKQQPVTICLCFSVRVSLTGGWASPSSQCSMVTTATHSNSCTEGSQARAGGAARADRALIGLHKRAGLGAWSRGKGRGGRLVTGKLSHNLYFWEAGCALIGP